MKKKRKAGGGRKKLPPELVKQAVTLFVETKYITAAGGIEALKEYLYKKSISLKPPDSNSPS
ncbi:hypothetical protein [Agriterribacter sp.]|uniref:hypothetical protein n=1 Tax=Agriterribacter sp. TaxID=2821509 RepID=UPI002BB89025|nr:hypothetical protein [Agriterribacter sp.]HRP58431.1 hypothetical protein [Agriterribacter sp.]